MENTLTPAQARRMELIELVRTLSDHHVELVHSMAIGAARFQQLYAEQPAAAQSNVIYGPWKRVARRRR